MDKPIALPFAHEVIIPPKFEQGTNLVIKSVEYSERYQGWSPLFY